MKPQLIEPADTSNLEPRTSNLEISTTHAEMQALESQFALAVRQRELLKTYIEERLKPGVHFMSIAGQKNSLLKQGAELIILAHGYIPDYEILSGPKEPPREEEPYQLTVRCVLRRRNDPNSFVGSGIGSASSYITSRDGSHQPRQNDPGLGYNATIKMAQKSALCAATLNSTAASEFFTQDMEDASSGASATNGQKQVACPHCGHPLTKSKGEFGGGYFCWKKKGGCGRKFTDEEIEKAGVKCEVPGVSDTSVLSTPHSVPEKPEEKISRLLLELKNISHHVALTPEEHEYLAKFCQAKSPTYAQVESKLSQVKKKISAYEQEQQKLAEKVGI